MKSMTAGDVAALRPGAEFYWRSPIHGWRRCVVTELLPRSLRFHFEEDAPQDGCIIDRADCLTECGVLS